MERLLNAIASKLTVRRFVEKQSDETLQGLNIIIRMFDYRDVTDEVRELFKKEFKNHLSTKLQSMKLFSYRFDYDSGANNNLEEVLLKLPTLNDEECYAFPSDTYIPFILTEREEKKLSIDLSRASPWIMEAYIKSKQ